jgi:predicted metal-dependent phosphoesterase TrpH
MKMLAALHVHSTYSDGELPLAQVRDLFLATGCKLVCMADHADFFDEGKLAAYIAECRQLSNQQILVRPGLEFECHGRMHIVGYGVEALIDSADPTEVIDHIARAGGVSVIAHPAPEHLPLIPSFPRLPDGIEVWNTKSDGPAAPRPAVFALLQELRNRKPDMLAFYGVDFHWKHQFRGLLNEITVATDGDGALIDALRTGSFEGVHGALRLPSNGKLPAELLADFAVRNARAGRVRKLLKRFKKWSGPLGRVLPAPLKSQLRRFF